MGVDGIGEVGDRASEGQARINLPLFSTVFPSHSFCFCPVGLSFL